MVALSRRYEVHIFVSKCPTLICRRFSFVQAFRGISQPAQCTDDSGLNQCSEAGLNPASIWLITNVLLFQWVPDSFVSD